MERVAIWGVGRVAVSPGDALQSALWKSDHNLFYFARKARETGRKDKNEYLSFSGTRQNFSLAW